ncbi:hypothetical protein E1B28_005341 [Marasmius oreades]|uniref:DUF6535 domain-containing protein n=1 Tax=Marasmius oreades TaxID=181124 RepID=A0A9P7S3M5_9AGAR|nr:uncharacterized protein E1B28_005341 [Marasmius oreades]KAG7094510.1 hypothetical protein E1B28_005341 [Marasmius oreades]
MVKPSQFIHRHSEAREATPCLRGLFPTTPHRMISVSATFRETTASSEDRQETRAMNIEKPTLRESWDVIMKTVDALDDDLVKGYKEDIDTLLVFAGLFSAVVTAFTVESYQWLQEDTVDKSVALLTQIAQQMSNPGQMSPSSTPFAPTSSTVRINTFWFLSLTLALVDALFGLLCKQWVREYQRKTNTKTPGQALALRWLRFQSFERWHVPKILASLPILLEVALFLFLAGLLELLWSRHHFPFFICLVVIGLAILFYLTTTIIPGLSTIHQTLRTHPYFASDLYPMLIAHLPLIDFVCPYKSPQSWLSFRLLSAIYYLPGFRWLIHPFLVKFSQNWYPDWDHDFKNLDHLISKNVLQASCWSSLDVNAIQRFSNVKGCPDLYQLKGFRWLVQETRDTPSMVPHLKNVLAELDPHLVMPAIFDRWDSPYKKAMWHVFDVHSALESSPSHNENSGLFDDQSPFDHSVIVSRLLCFQHCLIIFDGAWEIWDSNGSGLKKAAEDLWIRILKVPKNSQFVKVFFRPQELLRRPSRMDWCGTILDFYKEHWHELDIGIQVWLTERLSRSILRFLGSESELDVRSTHLASSYGLNFFTSVNDELCKAEFLETTSAYLESWIDVLTHVRRLHHLPILQFKPIPGYFPLLSRKFQRLLDDPSTSELDTLWPVLESYKQLWDKAYNSQKENLVSILSNHIHNVGPERNTKAPIPISSIEEPSQLPPLPSSIFTRSMKSRQPLEFLTFVNEKLIQDPDFLHDCWKSTVDRWVIALECVRVLQGLPPNYFRSIPECNGDGTVISYKPGNQRSDKIEKGEEGTGGERYELGRLKVSIEEDDGPASSSDDRLERNSGEGYPGAIWGQGAENNV